VPGAFTPALHAVLRDDLGLFPGERAWLLMKRLVQLAEDERQVEEGELFRQSRADLEDRNRNK
jgi:hypothetical protein